MAAVISLLITLTVWSAPEGCDSGYRAFLFPGEVNLELDGRADESEWKEVSVERRFLFPWDSRLPPETSFRAFLDDSNLYIFFAAQDSTLLSWEGSEEQLVASGDRVEIFFSLDSELSRYFCLELSPSNNVLDYEAAYYRKFRPEWDLAGLRTAAIQTSSSYTVEAAIPLSTLLMLGFPNPRPGPWIRIGLFRADFVQTSTGVEQNWLSWCLPAVDRPDFHVPSAFGFLEVTPIE
jgi:hypothetical protein